MEKNLSNNNKINNNKKLITTLKKESTQKEHTCTHTQKDPSVAEMGHCTSSQKNIIEQKIKRKNNKRESAHKEHTQFHKTD